MWHKRRSVKKLRKSAELFLGTGKRIKLLASISTNKEYWVRWVAEIKGALKNLDEGDYNKFSELCEKIGNDFNDKRQPVLDLLGFLTEKSEAYRNYDFYTKEEREKQRSFYRRIIEKVLSLIEWIRKLIV